MRVVAISVDAVEKSKALAADLGLSFPLLSDPNLAVIRAYGVADESNEIAWPAVFLIDRDRTIKWRSAAIAVGTRPSASDIIKAADDYLGRVEPR